jgi:hypothetical protein
VVIQDKEFVDNEAVAVIVGLVRQIAPAQKVDNFTADAWGPLLIGLPMKDVRQALVVIGQEQAFIAPSDIIREVRRMRNERIRSGPEFDPRAYPGCEESQAAYRAALRDHVDRLGRGEPALEPPPKQVTVRPVAELVAGLVAEKTADVEDRA